MKRTAVSLLFLIAGVLISLEFLVMGSRLKDRLSWPLVSTRWHGCWDTEHCAVSWVGYAAIVVFLVGPAVSWAIVGFVQARKYSLRRVAMSVVALMAATTVFYLGFYAAVWP
ncbi:hypothetical protein [Paraburkholderia flava]|uniref:hypothetical protein n=1 Tax=Paraburkholderia flava TaxID=2547393 RepID=UPI0010608E07|nr:hypothetical protein [Paraburkholderia flava]